MAKSSSSRHSSRPHTLDYVNHIFRDLIYLHGDKKYADDSAIIGCLAKINEISIMLIGTEKGNSMNLVSNIILVWLPEVIGRRKDYCY